MVLEGEVEPGEENTPSGLSLIQLLGRSEVLEVLVICQNFNCVRGSFQVMPPCLQSSDDSHELLVVDVVVSLGFWQTFWQEAYQMPLSVILELG
jgi:hypothetical protein